MNPLLTRFQFHKGAIGTCFFYIQISFLLGFNSIKVQLELVDVTTCMSYSYLFQFHKGAIGTARTVKPVPRSYVSIP